jgi:hypothetical protein
MKTTRTLLITLALAKLFIHLLTSQGYGFFRDEFYYIACSGHIDWGYVDHPPLSVVLLWGARNLLGDSLLAIRALPAVAGALAVYLVGLMARELEGGRFASVLAMTAAIAVPEYLGTNHVFSMNSFDILVWALSAYLLILLLKGGDKRLWILLGLVLGIGLQNKISVLWLGAGLGVGLLVTPSRRWLATPWPWITGALAFIVFSPYVFWQVGHGWPTLEFIENATTEKMAAVSAWDFLQSQILVVHPFNFPIWLSGLAFFLFMKSGRRYRLLGWIYLTVVFVLVSSGTSRSGYLAPAYTWLLAAGAVVTESATEKWRNVVRMRPVLVVVLILGGIATAPLALPVLPVEAYIRYAKAIGVAPSTEERKEIGALPQHYADMHGWREIVETVAEVYDGLEPDEKSRAAILAPNYGVAGAIDFIGSHYGLPSSICRHNNYWLWGPGKADGSLMLVIGASEQDLTERCASHERAATIQCGYCMPYENNRPVHICRDLKIPVAELWANSKNYN